MAATEKKKKSKGRGWHGNEEAHRRAGRLGGLARARNMRNKKR